MDDFAKIDHVPIAVASIDKGHGGTYSEWTFDSKGFDSLK